MSYLENLMERLFLLDHLHDFAFVAGSSGPKYLCWGTNYTDCYFNRILIFQIESAPQCGRSILHEFSCAIPKKFLSNWNRSAWSQCWNDMDNNSFYLQYTIVYIANMLGIISLQQECEQFLTKNISFGNCLRVLTIATDCDYFELFSKTWKFIRENFARISSEDAEDVIVKYISHCLKKIESRHLDLFPNLLQSIPLQCIQPKVNKFKIKRRNSIRLNRFVFQFLKDMEAALLSKYNVTNISLDDYCPRSSESLSTDSNALTSSWTTGEIYCIHYSSAQNHVIIQKYNSISSSWEAVKSLSCVSACIRHVYNDGKIFIIADQDRVRIVESYDLKTYERSVYSRILPLRGGFWPIVVCDYMYEFRGIPWHVNLDSRTSIDSLGR